ncbi:MAG: VOC family protein [Rhodobacteraceae bacterium]|nr:VOC family protein [Paracoccaceae bacterium]
MNFAPYLTFNNNCAEAMAFYANLFNGEVTAIQTFGESALAANLPPEMHKLVMHASLRISDQIIMASDDPSGNYVPPRGIQVQIGFPDFTEAQRVFEALALGGEIKMPFEKTFWTSDFGMVRDRFGIPWMVNCNDSD